MKRQTIDGRNVVQEFIVLHHEWECDGYGWVTEDGRIWHTDHSDEPYEISPNDCLMLMDTPLKSITGIHAAVQTALEKQEA